MKARLLCILLIFSMILCALPMTTSGKTWIDSVTVVGADSNNDTYNDTAVVTVSVKNDNTGAGPSYVTVSAKLFASQYAPVPGSMNYTSKEEKTINDPAKGATSTFTLKVGVTINSSSDLYTVLIEMRTDDPGGLASNNTTRTVRLTRLDIVNYFTLDLTGTTTYIQYVPLGQQTLYKFKLTDKNPGYPFPTTENYAIAIQTPPAGWGASVDKPQLTLGKGESTDITVTVQAPMNYTKGAPWSISLGVSVKPLTWGFMRKTITATIALPDYTINASGLSQVAAEGPNPDPIDAPAGQKVYLRAKVVNQGTVATLRTEVRFLIDGKNIGEFGEITVYFYNNMYIFAYMPWITTPGLHNLTVLLDPNRRETEFDETNNQAFMTFTTRAPELTVAASDITVDPARPNPGNITLRALIHNTGTYNASSVKARLTVGNYTQDVVAPRIASGNGSALVNFTWTAVSGDFQLELQLDPDNTVVELNETNNLVKKALHVNFPPTAVLRSSVRNADTGAAVTFYGYNSTDPDGTVVSYFYDFGDDTGSGWISTPNVTHKFKERWNYEVRLTVKDDNGLTSAPASRDIKVQDKQKGPLPGFELGPVLVAVGLIAMLRMRRNRRN